MAIAKSTVNTFIAKVRAKALLSVDDKYKALILEEAKRWLDEPKNRDLKKAIADCQEYGAKFDEAVRAVKEHTKNVYFAECGGIDILSRMFINGSSVTPPKIKEIRDAWWKERGEVANQYSAVSEAIRKQASGKKGYDLLKSLGFDVKWIEDYSKNIDTSIPKLDKDKLFVCGERS